MRTPGPPGGLETTRRSVLSSLRLGELPLNVWVVTLTSFLTDISSEMLVWLLPLFLSDTLGAPTAAIGLIEGCAETTASVLKVFSGWLSDRLGRRKWLAVGGYAISTAAKPFLLVVSTWAGVLAVRVGDRVGKGIRTAPRDALVADSIDASQRGLAFGIHRAGDTAGAVVGVLIALLVIGRGGPVRHALGPALQDPGHRLDRSRRARGRRAGAAGQGIAGDSKARAPPELEPRPVRRPVPMVPRRRGPVHPGQLVRRLPGPPCPESGALGPGHPRHGPVLQPGLQRCSRAPRGPSPIGSAGAPCSSRDGLFMP